MSYAKNFQTVEEAKPDYAVAGQPVYIHATDVAKLFRLHFQLMNENEYGDIDAGHRLIMFRKKLIEWESL